MNTQVLIVGAGPTGLTLACDLARRGVPHRIVERASSYFPGSRGDGLQPRTLEVFEDLGVLDAIMAAGTGAPLMRVYNGAEVVAEMRMAELTEPTPDVPHPNLWFVPQYRTEEILRARLAEFGGRVELATELVGFVQDADGVTATLRHDGVEEEVRVDHLVGADGGRSTVRKGAGIAFVGDTDETTKAMLADVLVDGLDHSHGYVWMHEGDGLALTPLAVPDLFNLAGPPPADGAEPTHEWLQELVDTASGRTDIRIREVVWATVWRANVRTAERFQDGRVLLAGDAAHVCPPTGGQGLNTGVQDAYNLGWKLATSRGLVDTYAVEREPIAQGVLELAARTLKRLMEGDEGAYQRGSEFHQLGLNYRGGPLSRDDRAVPGPLPAGDRAPDAPCHENGLPTRLFEVFRGPRWTVLELRDGLAVVGDRTLVDTDGHLGAAYGVDGFVVVRPDGYVGLVADDRAAVDAYLDPIAASATGSTLPRSEASR
ncbi:FAD-dependent monooxygenase [Umezawaea sp. Da 62-37]|uniref:FAD-dependent monooxygenase n=1 Tax=Umezawaea sp. Da 62-37 TaxID=3075927 RepID=UPI0028F6F6F3|nr:FAD-dependent monooxygenase [Umezawaea sp. Da 62-37]WNV82689.1 FAD-dependent monooxygenase [Umezawaea sp. Da 62-37]